MAKPEQSRKERENLKNQESKDDYIKICRICLEENSGYMISPCACLGNSKFVHEECLKTWIKIKFQTLQDSSCEVCKEKFTTRKIRHMSCKKKSESSEITCRFIKLLVIGLIMLISSLTAFILIVLFLDRGKFSLFFGVSVLVFLPIILFSTITIFWSAFKLSIEVTYDYVLGTYSLYSLQTNPDTQEPDSN